MSSGKLTPPDPAQVQTYIGYAHSHLEGKEMQQKLFDALLDASDKGMTAQDVLNTIYKKEVADFTTYSKVSGLWRELCQTLGKVNDVKDCPVEAKWPQPGRGYRIWFEYKPTAPVDPESANPDVPQKPSDVSDTARERIHSQKFYHHVPGGIRYETEQMGQLSTFWETHTRHPENFRNYTGAPLPEFSEALGKFLQDPEHRYVLIVGQAIEKAYVDALATAIGDRENQVKIYQLPYPGMLMNFDILEYPKYENGKARRDVLFGWGRYEKKPGEDGKVFLTSNDDLADEFSAFYKSLIDIWGTSISLERLKEVAEESETAKSTDAVLCHYVGDNNKALEYEIKKMPYLEGISNTHTRPAFTQSAYNPALLKRWKDAIKKFLSRTDIKTSMEAVIGENHEESYLKAVKEAAKEANQEGKFKFHLLPYTNPMMNFCILHYHQRTPSKEVLFGWGRYNRRRDEHVFRSSDERIVEEFERLYDALVVSSSPNNQNRIIPPHLPEDENLRVYDEWETNKVKDLLLDTDNGTEVRILTTIFLKWSAIDKRVRALLEKGIHVKIILMNPDNQGLVESRFRRRKDITPTDAIDKIRRQIDSFNRIRKETSSPYLTVKVSDLMPFGFFVQNDKKAIVGLLPPTLPYDEVGAMIEIPATSPLFKTLKCEWETYWDDQPETVVPPDEENKHNQRRV